MTVDSRLEGTRQSEFKIGTGDIDSSSSSIVSIRQNGGRFESKNAGGLWSPVGWQQQNVSSDVSPADPYVIYYVDTSLASRTIALPNIAASIEGFQFRIVKMTSDNDLVVTTVGGTDLIGGYTSQAIVLGSSGFTVAANNGSGTYEIIQDSRPRVPTSSVNHYALDVASSIAGFYKASSTTEDPDYDATPVDFLVGPVTGSDQYMGGFISEAGTILGVLSDQTYSAIGNLRRVSGLATAQIYIEVYKRGPEDGSVLSFADAGGGQVTVTCSAAHGLSDGDFVTIYGTTNYNGNYEIASASGSVFDITATWVSTETGTWAHETLLCTTSSSPELSNSSYETFSVSGIIASATLGSDDRIATKLYMSRGVTGSNPSFELQLMGSSPARSAIEVPVSAVAHNSLVGLGIAGSGVDYGHVSDGDQSIAGAKTFEAVIGGRINLGSSSATIASGVISVGDTSRVVVDTEGSAATDDLDTITGGEDGDLLVLTCADDARTVVVKDGSGIALAGGVDFSLDHTDDVLVLLYLTDHWVEMSRSDNS